MCGETPTVGISFENDLNDSLFTLSCINHVACLCSCDYRVVIQTVITCCYPDYSFNNKTHLH